jgi:hypothetical protein
MQQDQALSVSSGLHKQIAPFTAMIPLLTHLRKSFPLTGSLTWLAKAFPQRLPPTITNRHPLFGAIKSNWYVHFLIQEAI